MWGIRKLTKFGDSHAIIIPAKWLNIYAMQIDGNYYVEMRVEDDQIIFSPINEEDLLSISVREK
jgi:antitoxin component of MazEF toxin-antitoxin module